MSSQQSHSTISAAAVTASMTTPPPGQYSTPQGLQSPLQSNNFDCMETQYSPSSASDNASFTSQGNNIDVGRGVQQQDNPPGQTMAHSFVQMFGLTIPQYEEMAIFLQMGSTLPHEHMAVHAFTVASVLRLQNCIKEYNNGLARFGHILEELKARLDNTFQVTQSQKNELHMIAKELMFKPSVAMGACYQQIYTRVLEVAAQHAGTLSLPTNLNSTQTKTYNSCVRKICSMVRQSAERDIMSTIRGQHAMPLAKAVFHLVGKYSKPSTIVQATHSHKALIVILRYHAYDHVERYSRASPDGENLATAEQTNEEEGSSDEEDTQSSATKKRKNCIGSGTKVAVKKIPPYWAKVDEWFKAKKEEWGTDMNKGQWDVFIKQLILDDQSRWDARNATRPATGNLIPQATTSATSSANGAAYAASTIPLAESTNTDQARLTSQYLANFMAMASRRAGLSGGDASGGMQPQGPTTSSNQGHFYLQG
ncbi:hypothetical protein FRC02_011571 [Tulasnella sp. 418]|nr:hypothetical protein FRC02_011571 [Tulasnella sp. 418]